MQYGGLIRSGWTPFAAQRMVTLRSFALRTFDTLPVLTGRIFLLVRGL